MGPLGGEVSTSLFPPIQSTLLPAPLLRPRLDGALKRPVLDPGRGPAFARCPRSHPHLQTEKCQVGAPRASCGPPKAPDGARPCPSAPASREAPCPQPALGSETRAHEPDGERQPSGSGVWLEPAPPGRRRGRRIRSPVNGHHCLPRHLGSPGCQDPAPAPTPRRRARARLSISGQGPSGSPARPPFSRCREPTPYPHLCPY